MRFVTMCLLLLPLIVVAAEPKPVTVFITTAGAKDGFTDPSKENIDTANDLRSRLYGKKGLALVRNREDAQVVLTVMGRETAQVTAGFLGDPARDRSIRVRLSAGEFETDLTASAQGGTLGSGGAWGRAAGKIAGQVEDWIKRNRAKISADVTAP